VDGRVRSVIILASAGRGESTAILKTEKLRPLAGKEIPVQNSLGSKSTPRGVNDLLGNQRREIKLWVILIRFCSWIRNESLLIEMFGNLSIIVTETSS
jgi:hypothetical protein